MDIKEYTCPHCLYSGKTDMFEPRAGDELKCRRCRSVFRNPHHYLNDITYAECDENKMVFRYPFSLSGTEIVIRIRKGDLVLLEGATGERLWLENEEYRIDKSLSDFQLYFIHLVTRIKWGASAGENFGAYGEATIRLTKEYVKNYCGRDISVMRLPDHVRKKVCQRVESFISEKVAGHQSSVLERKESYFQLEGEIENGIVLSQLELMGFRNTSGNVERMNLHRLPDSQGEAEPYHQKFQPPIEKITLPKTSYTIKQDVEEVFFHGTRRRQRHKAGERIDHRDLRGVTAIYRYSRKQFELPYGWGCYNQPLINGEYLSAHGEVSFFIDNTDRMSQIVSQAKSWTEFEDLFFHNIFQREVSEEIGGIINDRISQRSLKRDQLRSYLSELSVDLTDRLNKGEKDGLWKYGLRIRQIDIMNIDIYASRR